MNSVKDYLTHHMKSDDSDNENQSQNEFGESVKELVME